MLKRFLWLLLIVSSAVFAQQNPPAAVSQIEQILGLQGTFNPQQQVLVINLPQSEFGVRAAGVRISPPMGLQSWIDIKIINDKSALVLADLVLTQEQVNAVISTALNNNLKIMALVNQFSWESPRLMYLNIAAISDPVTLAKNIKAVLNTIQATQNIRMQETFIDPDDTNLSADKVNSLGYKSEFQNGVYVIRIPEKTTYNNIGIGSDMGIISKIIFVGTEEKAVTTGGFVVGIPELQSLLKALRDADINIVAINQPLLQTKRPLIFVRFWGVGKFDTLLQGIRHAITYLPKTMDDQKCCHSSLLRYLSLISKVNR